MKDKPYAHELWFERSMLIRCYKNRLKNQHWRRHHPVKGHARDICLTKTQAALYDHIVLLPKDTKGHIELLKLNSVYFNKTALASLIKKNIYIIKDSKLIGV